MKNINCDEIDYQRKMVDDKNADKIFEIVKDTFIHEDCVFFGGYAISEYSQYMPDSLRKRVEKYADFDVLARDPKTTAEIVKERLSQEGIKNVKIIKRDSIGEIIPLHYEIMVGRDTIAFIYKPNACHSYNVVMLHGKKIKIATIDTMLSFYFAFLYANKSYYDHERILCMAKFLFDIQQKNRLEQKGLLKRFSIICYGHQESVEEMRAEKAKKFKELKDKRGTREFEEWFLSYRPSGKRKGEKDKGEKDKGEKDKGEKKKNNKSFKKTFKFRTWKNKNKTSKNKNELY